MVDKQGFIRRKAQQHLIYSDDKNILWSHHAIVKLVTENLSHQEIEQALGSCEVIEDYPTQVRPLPDCLVLGWTTEEGPIHAVIAIDKINDRLFVITVYRPNSQRWSHDYRIRKD